MSATAQALAGEQQGAAGVLVLAAGRSRRFGADKRHALLPSGRTVLWQVIDRVRDAGLPLLTCLGGEDVELAAALQSGGVPVMRCLQAHRGMGATLAEGAAALPPWRAAIVALADMPWVTPATFLDLASATDVDGITVPRHDGRRGNPVAFGARFFPVLMRCTGDRGARTVLSEAADRVRELPVSDPGILRDIDRPADLPAATGSALR